jgi:biotin-dependent carboxylase-like uncharacterized protein
LSAVFKIDQVGPFVSVQDKGRFGYMRFGVTEAGPMDRLGHAMANFAVGNPETDPAIEISLGGLTLTCVEGEITACVAGGSFDVHLDGQELAPWSIFTMSVGSKLRIRTGAWGSWTYLAFAGQLDADSWLGSSSTHMGSGLCGASFVQDDIIKIENPRVLENANVKFYDPEHLKPSGDIHVVMGPQDRYFTEKSIASLLLTEYEVTNEYNRMGVRLKGEKLEINQALDMPSEPIARGSLQVPGHGDPICLLADHQTTGGYPKIATVISPDQDRLVQLRAGNRLRFIEVTPMRAVEMARQRKAEIDVMKAEIEANRVGYLQKLWSSNLISGVVGPNQSD